MNSFLSKISTCFSYVIGDKKGWNPTMKQTLLYSSEISIYNMFLFNSVFYINIVLTNLAQYLSHYTL